jgi:transposase
MTMVAELVDAVVGGDTHKDTHTLQMMTPTGVVLGEVQIGNDPAGYQDAIGWIGRHTPGPRVVIGVEGTRSYGAGRVRWSV